MSEYKIGETRDSETENLEKKQFFSGKHVENYEENANESKNSESSSDDSSSSSQSSSTDSDEPITIINNYNSNKKRRCESVEKDITTKKRKIKNIYLNPATPIQYVGSKCEKSDLVSTNQLTEVEKNSETSSNENNILPEGSVKENKPENLEIDHASNILSNNKVENNVVLCEDNTMKQQKTGTETSNIDVDSIDKIEGHSKIDEQTSSNNNCEHEQSINKSYERAKSNKRSNLKKSEKSKKKISIESSSELAVKKCTRTRSRSLSPSKFKNDNSKFLAFKEQKTNKSFISNKNEKTRHPDSSITARQRRTVDLLTSRTGGAYIPPAKLRLLQAEITDKSSAAYQRIAWEALKKSIHGYINKVNVDNISIITRELLKENIIRGRGLLCRSIIQAQAASPTFTHVYGALVAIINSKFPNIGELLLKRLVIQFKRGFRRNDKLICLSSARFIAHLVNQRVAHEILALEILTLLVESPTDDSVEVAIAFLRECGMKLTEVSSKGISAIFDMLKNILHEGKLDKRVQYMIEVVFQVRKDGFKDHQSVIESLELVEEDDQFTHLITLDEVTETQDHLNVFKFDDKYQENESRYSGLSKELLGSDAEDSNSELESDDKHSDESDEIKKPETIIDNTETNLVALRRTIYLTIHSSLDYEECAHKLMKMELKPGQESELCHMFLDCCAEQRTYEKFYGLLAQRFCAINKIYVGPFEEIFKATYSTTHRLDTNRLRNVSKFFAHLLFTDAIGWDVMECIHLNEEETTSSSRIFIKILFQELAEYMGLSKLNTRLKILEFADSFSGLFPKDNPKNTRFAINFFTSIGLGGLTDDLRQFLKTTPKANANEGVDVHLIKANSTSSTSSTSSSSRSSSSSCSDSEFKNLKSNSTSKRKIIKKKREREKTAAKNLNQQINKNKHKKKYKKVDSTSSSSSESESSSSASTSSKTRNAGDKGKNKIFEKNLTNRKVGVDRNPFRNNEKQMDFRNRDTSRSKKESHKSQGNKCKNRDCDSISMKSKSSRDHYTTSEELKNLAKENEKSKFIEYKEKYAKKSINIEKKESKQKFDRSKE